MKKSIRNNGFSLVELLTVIAIIAILAAVIFPIMGAVKDTARRNDCMTKLHAIAMGVDMYKKDNRKYPMVLGSEVYTEPDSSGVRRKWVTAGGTPEMFENVKGDYLFAEYVSTIRGFHCPSAKTTNSRDVVRFDRTSGEGSDSGGEEIAVYAYDSYDSWIIGPGDNKGDYSEYSEGAENAERRYYINWAPIPTVVGRCKPYPPSTTDTVALKSQDYARQLRFRNPPKDTVVTWCSYHEGLDHRGKTLVVFLDGHMDVFPASEVIQCKWRVRPQKS